MTVHELKCRPTLFDDIRSGRKSFDIRKNDRGFQTGDVIKFRKFCPSKKEYTSPPESLTADIGYVLSGFGLRSDYVCLGLNLFGKNNGLTVSVHEAMRESLLGIIQLAEANGFWVEVELYGGSKGKRDSSHCITKGVLEIDGDCYVSISDGIHESWWYSVGYEPKEDDPPSIVGVKIIQFPHSVPGGVRVLCV